MVRQHFPLSISDVLTINGFDGQLKDLTSRSHTFFCNDQLQRHLLTQCVIQECILSLLHTFFPNNYYSGLQKPLIELGIQEEKEIESLTWRKLQSREEG